MKQLYDPLFYTFLGCPKVKKILVGCFFIIGLTLLSTSTQAQCVLDATVSVGACRYNEITKQSEVLVAVSADWSNQPSGALIEVSFKGITKTIDPANAGCPGYTQFIVPLTLPMPTPEVVTVRFTSGSCAMLTKNVTLPAGCPAPTCNGATFIGGHTFSDFDADGVRDASEFGVGGVTVKVFDCNNNELCSTVSGQNGIWACANLVPHTLVRVEFSNLPTGYFSGGTGRDNRGGTVQFAAVRDCEVDFGMVNPNAFCEDNPWIVTPCYVNGAPTPGSEPGNAGVLVAVEYNSPAFSTDVNKYFAPGAEVGSIWGVAYDKKTKKLFTASLLKRHSGLGPGGLGGIYLTDLSSLPVLPPITGNTSLFINLDNLGINTGNEASITRDLTPSLTQTSYDPEVFDLVGKWGLGDIDLSEDGKTLYTVNLFMRTLVIIDVATKTATQVSIPASACSNATDWRPWGLEFNKGKLYVGGVCSGQSTYGSAAFPKGDRNLLSATVYEFDPLLRTFTEALSFPLTFPKGSSTSFLGASDPATSYQWNVWTNNFADLIVDFGELSYPQPILSDIEFDIFGNMMLGFIDRSGHQMGWYNYGTSSSVFGTKTYKGNSAGDVLRVYNNNGTWLLEQNGQAGYDVSAGVGNGEGPCGGEFYYQDAFGGSHEETTHGGLAIHPSNNELILSVMDPYDIYSAGIAWYNNATGAANKRIQIYRGSAFADGTFGKSAGLGDLELICGEASIQVGNYVWDDKNKNGIQDGCEDPIKGMYVSIYQSNGTFIASDTTEADGNYKFSNLEPNTSYIIAFGTNGQSQGGVITVSGNKYVATTTNVTNNTRDRIDSDISVAGSGLPAGLQGLQTVSFTTGVRGDNNHTYDAGFILSNFICPTIPTLTTPANLCADATFSVAATGLTNLALTGNLVQNFGIQFVYFNEPTSNPYSGGTSLGTVPFASLTASSTTATLNNLSLPSGVYQVYAILSPAPVEANCRPFATSALTVVNNPTAVLTFDDQTTVKTICVGGTASISYQVNLPPGFGCNWILKDKDGTTLANGSTSIGATTIPIPNVSNLAPGSYSYNLGANCTSGGCGVADKDKTITLTVLPDPATTLAFNGGGTTKTICVGSPASIDYGTTLPNGTCTWTLNGQNVNLSGSNSVNNTTIAIPNAEQLAPGTYNYTLAANCTTGGCNIDSKIITLTVLPDPISTLLFNGGGTTKTICVGSSASIDYSTILPNGGSCTWTLTGQNVNLNGSSSVNTTTIPIPNAAQLTPGTYNYTLAANCTTGGCNVASKTITLTVLSTPTTTLIFNGGGATKTICAGSTASIDYSTTLPNGGNCTWTLTGQNVNLSGSASIGSTTVAIPNAAQLAPGTYNYTLAANCTTGGCNVESKTITLTVLSAPVTTLSFNGGGATATKTICVGSSASIDYSTNLPNGGSCNWTLTGQNVNVSGTSSVNTTTIPIPNADQLAPGTYNYTLAASCTTGGCNVANKIITLTVLSAPATTLSFNGGDFTKTICVGSSASIDYSTTLPNGGNCTWTLTGQNVNLSGSASIGSTTVAIPNAAQLAPGTYNYTLAANCTTGGCNVASKVITLTVLPDLSTSFIFNGGGTTKTICAGSTASIDYSLTLPNGGDCTWTLTGQNLNLSGSTSASNTTIPIPNAAQLAPGTYNYTLSASCATGGCNVATKTITLTVLSDPTTTLIFNGGGATKTICAGSTASIDYSLILPNGGDCTWTLTGQNLNLSGSSSVSATTIVIPNAGQLAPGNYMYTLVTSCATGGCNVESQAITLTVLPDPTTTLIFNGGGIIKTICAGSTASIDYSMTLPNGGDCTWTLTGQNLTLSGSGSITTTTIAIPNANQLVPGTYTYTLTPNCTTGGCDVASKTITLTVLPDLASSLIFNGGGATKTICTGSTASIDYSMTLTDGGACNWTLTGQNVNLSGSSSVSTTTIAIPNAEQLAPGTYTYTLTPSCTNGGCNAASKIITLTVLPDPLSSLIFNGGGTTKTICAGDVASMNYNVSLPSGSNCNWTLTGQNVNLTGTSSANATSIAIPNATQLAPGTYNYTLSANCTTGSCNVESKIITLTVLPDVASSLSFNGGGAAKTICVGSSASIDYSVTFPTGSSCGWTLTGQNVNLSGSSSAGATTIAIPNANQLAPGTYTYTLAADCSSGNCGIANKQITLTVSPAPNTTLNFNGGGTTKTICAGSAVSIDYSVNMPAGSSCGWTLKGQNVNLSGSSSVSLKTLTIPNIGQLPAGTYTYTLGVTCISGGCNVTNKTITLIIIPDPVITLSSNSNCSSGPLCGASSSFIDYSVTLPSGNDCIWTLKGQNLNISGSSSVRATTVSIPNFDQLAPGNYSYTLSVNCTTGNCNVVYKTIWLNVGRIATHDYIIGFPADKSGECGTVLDTTIYIQENACDLLAVSVVDHKLIASGDECYKIKRVFSVINWCEYDGISDPYVINRDVDGDGKPGDEDIWVMRRQTRTILDRSGNSNANWTQNLPKIGIPGTVILPDETDPIPAANTEGKLTPPTDEFPEAPWNGLNPRGAWDWANIKSFTNGGTNDDNSASDDKLYAKGQRTNQSGNLTNYTTGFWSYTQFIKVYDDIDPTIAFEPQVFCSYSSDIAKGCPALAEVVFTVDESCTPNDLTIKVFLDAFANGTIDASSLLPANTLKTSFGAVVTGVYPNYTIAGGFYPLGNHVFEVHVLDGCGNATVARIPFSVVDCKAPSPICINGLAVELMPVNPAADVDGDGDIDNGAMVIWAKDFIASPVTDCSGPVSYSINKVGQTPDISKTSLILTCDDPSTLQIEIYAWDNANNPTALQPNGTTGGRNYDKCLTYVLLQDNLFDVCGQAGPGTIAGTILTEESEPMEKVNVQLSGQSSKNKPTTEQGTYAFPNLQTGYDYTITPSLDVNPKNGVSTFDIILITKHILGVAPLNSPYKLIAADINSSKSITSLDLIQLRKLILSVDNDFTHNTSWRFVDASFVFPNPANPWATEFPEVYNVNDLVGVLNDVNFVAIKIGDVNGSAATSSINGVEVRDLRGVFAFEVADQPLKAGRIYTIDFKATDIANIQGYQATLTFDANALELMDIVDGEVKAENFGLQFIEEGVITTSWHWASEASAKASTSDAVLFSLVFRAKTDATLSELLNINSRYTLAEAYGKNDELKDMAIRFNNGTVARAGFELHQNIPNPFKGLTMISFNLPTAADATLTISDITGKVIKRVSGFYEKGYNRVELSSNGLPAGVLTYTLQSGEFTATKKMVIVK